MKRYHSWYRLLAVLTVIATFLATGCGGAATEAPAEPAATEAPTEPPAPTEAAAAEPTTTLAPATFDLYLPDFTDAGRMQVSSQIEQFMLENPDVSVNVSFANYSELVLKLSTMAAAGAPPAMAALSSGDVLNLAQQSLAPLSEQTDFTVYRDGLVRGITLNGQVYGYPWQGSSACRSLSLNLVIFQNNPPETFNAANRLGEFLTNYYNQSSNLDQLGWKPTLNQIYADKGIECMVVNTTDPALIQEALGEANALAEIFSNDFGVTIDASKAVGLDATLVGGEAGKLASSMAPAIDEEQFYNDRLVLGVLSVDHDNIAKFTGLPVDGYLITCVTEKWDCVAVSATTKEEIPINPATMYIEASTVEGPVAFYEQGSIGGCFKVYDDVKVCVSLF